MNAVRNIFLPPLLIGCLLSFSANAQNISYDLKAVWQFKKSGDKAWNKATVPGTVHTDLLANKLIPDPFYRDNETKLQWISAANWEYQGTFDLTPKAFSKKHIELIFEGLDTYADVYLNEHLILQANNMFRTWITDVKHLLKQKRNKLFIIFHSAGKVSDSIAQAQLPLVRPGDNNRHYVRKAQYHFGWDFAPKLTTCGIWRKVKLEAWDDLIMREVSTELKIIQNSFGSTRERFINYKIQADTTITIEMPLFIKNKNKWQPTPPFVYASNWSNPMEFERSSLVTVNKGMNSITYRFSTYSVKDSIFSNMIWDQKDKLIDSFQFKITNNVIKLVQQTDSIGQSFYFTVNNKSTFIKGANWVPADVFLPRVTKSKYRRLLIAAKDANINMLRVWGGGIYEDDYFYDLCDSLNIMVWQDFMFAGAMYPADSAFLENIKQEAIDNIKRLRRHPCIALWCGNNEIDEAWNNWGWQKQFKLSAQDSTKLWNDYQKLFLELLPQLVKEYDSARPYITSSPTHGWGRKESMTAGDSHYWGVWWGLQPIEKYKEKIPRFMSEYGMQSMPNFETIKQFSLPTDWDTSSVVMKVHQKHATGYKTLAAYILQNGYQAKTFTGFAAASQLVQSNALQTAISTHMNAAPRCMGTMFWQFNDCWPVTSWSVIDFYGRKKQAYYTVQRLYKSKKQSSFL